MFKGDPGGTVTHQDGDPLPFEQCLPGQRLLPAADLVGHLGPAQIAPLFGAARVMAIGDIIRRQADPFPKQAVQGTGHIGGDEVGKICHFASMLTMKLREQEPDVTDI